VTGDDAGSCWLGVRSREHAEPLSTHTVSPTRHRAVGDFPPLAHPPLAREDEEGVTARFRR